MQNLYLKQHRWFYKSYVSIHYQTHHLFKNQPKWKTLENYFWQQHSRWSLRFRPMPKAMLQLINQLKNRQLLIPLAEILWTKITMAFAIISEQGQAAGAVQILLTKTEMVSATTGQMPEINAGTVKATKIGMASAVVLGIAAESKCAKHPAGTQNQTGEINQRKKAENRGWKLYLWMKIMMIWTKTIKTINHP